MGLWKSKKEKEEEEEEWNEIEKLAEDILKHNPKETKSRKKKKNTPKKRKK